MRYLSGVGVLIGAEKGLFRFNAESREVAPAGNASTGSVNAIGGPSGGGVLIDPFSMKLGISYPLFRETFDRRAAQGF